MSRALIPAIIALAFGGVLILALTGVGIYILIRATRIRRTADESLRWPDTIGTVEEAEVRKTDATDDDSGADHYPYIVYTYKVEGQTYRSHRIRSAAIEPTEDMAEAQRVLMGYPVGSTVPVFYNPKDPSQAVLKRAPARPQTLIIIGVVCVVLALCLGTSLALGAIYYLR